VLDEVETFDCQMVMVTRCTIQVVLTGCRCRGSLVWREGVSFIL